MKSERLRLGVNIDHVATVRNARGGWHPDPLRAAKEAEKAGADGITAHLREDRRHIQDYDLHRIKDGIGIPLNMEMAATDEMLNVALKVQPHAVCLVPEKREELTTEGGLDAVKLKDQLLPYVQRLAFSKIRVALFLEPDRRQLDAAKYMGAGAVELHTGRYCNLTGEDREKELHRIREAAAYTRMLGMECHAGHGLNFENVRPIAAIAEVQELNIGHFLIGEAIFTGLEASIAEMRLAMEEGRARATSAKKDTK